MPSFKDLDAIRLAIAADYLRACESIYFINPRSDVDPETGETVRGEGLQRFRLYPEQRRTAGYLLAQQQANVPVRVVIVKPRQSGDSTHAAAWTFHNFYWKYQRRAIVIAHHESTTNALYQMYQTFYNELPPELQWKQRRYNRKELAFEAPSGSSMIAQTAGYLDIGHGLTIHHAHFSEIDLWPDPEIALEGLFETIPMTAGTSIIIESKAQGADGWLHHFWRASKLGQTGFLPRFTAWYQVPEYRMPVPRDFEVTREEHEWIEEYGISVSQVVWYRAKKNLLLAKEPWGGDRRMKASYPFTDEEAFQSSGFCVFPDSVLIRLRDGLRPPVETVRLVPTGVAQFKHDRCDRGIDGALELYRKPETQRQYSLGVDVSDGVGLTESVVSVFAYPGYEQVAEWASNQSSVEHTAWVARHLAELYGGANTMIIPETNKSGVLVLYILNQLPGNYSIFRWRYLDRPGISETNQPMLGWTTNEGTKKILAQVSNLLFMAGVGEVRSPMLHDQMTRCVDVLPGRRWRVAGKGTDRVLAALISITGAYLEFEGGSMGGISSADHHVEDEKRPHAERGYFDADFDKDFGFARAPSRTGPYSREDWEP